MHIIDSHFHWWPRSVSERLCKRKTFPYAHAQRPRRLHLSAPGRRRLHPQQLDRVVRPRQAARAHGRARPPGRRGLLDRSVLGVLLRPAGARKAATPRPTGTRRWPARRRNIPAGSGRAPRCRCADTRIAIEVLDDAVSRLGLMGVNMPGCDRRRSAHRRRAARAVLCARRGARHSDVPASDRRGVRRHAGRL